MTDLFRRVVRINVAGRLLEGLDAEFSINKSTKPSANTADLTIYNLNPENRQYLQNLDRPAVEVRAGYQQPQLSEDIASQLDALGFEGSDEVPLLFLGEMKEVTNRREQTDWVTTLTAGDGQQKQRANVNKSFGPGVKLEKLLAEAADRMGVGIGNAVEAIKRGEFAGAVKEFANGAVLSGNASEELQRLLTGAGLEGSVQNGQLQILPRGGALNSRAVLLTPDTGLIGSPEVGEKGTVKARSLLNPEIIPGRKVTIQSAAVDSTFVVRSASFTGTTSDNDYFVDLEAKPLG